ncbi:MAG: hypothetical protein HY913_24100 [Desulfomonile tiedjei]|nr:hypothetical protein [Desulfomonile tiedjei]
MDNGVIFGIVAFALAVIMFGSVLIFRRGRGEAGSSVGGGGKEFKDCYDLCTQDSRLASEGCATMCTTQGSP